MQKKSCFIIETILKNTESAQLLCLPVPAVGLSPAHDHHPVDIVGAVLVKVVGHVGEQPANAGAVHLERPAGGRGGGCTTAHCSIWRILRSKFKHNFLHINQLKWSI